MFTEVTTNVTNFDHPNYNESYNDGSYNPNLLVTFADYYKPIHGYLSLLVCIFGIFANLLNIVVLTR